MAKARSSVRASMGGFSFFFFFFFIIIFFIGDCSARIVDLSIDFSFFFTRKDSHG